MNEHLQLVEDCEARESRMTDWERTFIDDIGRKVARGLGLTEREAARLNEVWERVTAKG